MTLLAPSALWWLALAAPIVALFLYRRRVVEITVPSILFWEADPNQQRFGELGRHLRRWLSLLIHLAVLLLLVIALTRPSWFGRVGHLTIVLDDSATMQTREPDGRTRFEHAVAELLRSANEKPDGTRATLVLAGDPPRVLARELEDPGDIAQVARQARPRDVDSGIREALSLAHRLAPGESTKAILLSDRTPEPADMQRVDEFRKIGADRPNVGIRHVALAADESALDVFLAEHRSGPSRVTLRLIANGETQCEESSTLRDGGATLRLRPKLRPGTPFEITLEPRDDFDLDNRFFGVWPMDQRTRVQLVSPGSRSLLAALDQPDITLLHDAQQRRPFAEADVTIFDSPLDAPQRPVAGRFIILGGRDPFGVARTARPVDDLRPTQWAPRSPFLRDVDLMTWRIRRSAGLSAPPGAQVLVLSGEVPLLFLVERKLGARDSEDVFQGLYVNFTLNDSNLDRSAGLAILLWNAIETLQGRRPEDAVIAHPVGGPLAFPARKDRAADILNPAGESLPAYRDGDRLILPFAEHAGFYQLTTPTGPVLRAANVGASLAPRRDVEAETPVAAKASPIPVQWLELPPWAKGILLALGVVIAEFFAFYLRIERLD